MLIRVFSARDYEGHGNDGAVLVIQAAPESDQQAHQQSSGSTLPLVTVRPQVLRSVNKARAEARRRKGSTPDDDTATGSEATGSSANGSAERPAALL
mmetsp:Transcript_9868/g.13883  ORF Transcript_9868/g.13883 Transcript_9868/m.13883 type:complete len:97 (-) Transcript_9868:3-293(-)